MKLINKIISTLLLLTIVTSCSLFEDSPRDKVSENKVWKSPILLDGYVLPWYKDMSNGFGILMPTNAFLKNLGRPYQAWYTDQISVGRPDWYSTLYGDILRGNVTSYTSRSRSEWNTYYKSIRSINLLLENTGKISEGKQKNRVIGEAHFFRAYYYYLLWQRFGGVMLIDHVFDPQIKIEKFPRASYQEMLNFIVADAEKAVSLLDNRENSENGRITSGAARMLIAKAYLWASSPTFQNKGNDLQYLGFPEDRSNDMLAKAKEIYQAIIDTKDYKLIEIKGTSQDEIAKEYHKIFLTKFSEESILEYSHSDDGNKAIGSGHNLDRYALASGYGGTSCAFTPTQNHVDLYGMQDGFTFDENNPYLHRDYRFYANILYNGANFRSRDLEIYKKVEGGKIVGEGKDLKSFNETEKTTIATNTGYYMRKFVDASQDVESSGDKGSNQDYPIWRYSEAILDMAEVCFRLGEVPEATELVNQIRKRVHMPLLSNVSFEDIKKERMVELAFEDCTYWDIIRWNEYKTRLNGSSSPLRKVDIVNFGTELKYRYRNVNESPISVRAFDDYMVYWPIPWDEIRYHGVTQNPKWRER